MEEGVRIRARTYPVASWVRWVTAAGLTLETLLEPEPLDVSAMRPEDRERQVPYWSDDWLELYPVLSRVPVVLVLKARKPS